MDRKFGYIDHQRNDPQEDQQEDHQEERRNGGTVRPGGVEGGGDGGGDGSGDGGGDTGETGRGGDNKGGDKGCGDGGLREGSCKTRGSSTTKMIVGTFARASGEKGRSIHIRTGDAFEFNAPEADLYVGEVCVLIGC